MILVFVLLCICVLSSNAVSVHKSTDSSSSLKSRVFELVRHERTIEQNKEFFARLRARKSGLLPPRKHRLAFLGQKENALKKTVPTVPMLNLDDEAYIGKILIICFIKYNSKYKK